MHGSIITCNSPLFTSIAVEYQTCPRSLTSSPFMSHSKNSIPPPSAPSQVFPTPTPKGARLESKGNRPGVASPLKPKRSSAPDRSGAVCPGRKRVRICFKTDSRSIENRLARCKSSIEVVLRISTVESSSENDVVRSVGLRPRASA